tara:strand:- start:307 stop:651 length:345 start_codon:yes stop_codon:yes gene_type:complete
MKRLTVHLENQQTVDTQKPMAQTKKSTSKSAYERGIEQGVKDKAQAVSGDDKKPKSKGRFKTYTTITVRDLKTSRDIENALSDVRSKHTIAICKDSKRSYWKAGDEMFHIANQK